MVKKNHILFEYSTAIRMSLAQNLSTEEMESMSDLLQSLLNKRMMQSDKEKSGRSAKDQSSPVHGTGVHSGQQEETGTPMSGLTDKTTPSTQISLRTEYNNIVTSNKGQMKLFKHLLLADVACLIVQQSTYDSAAAEFAPFLVTKLR